MGIVNRTELLKTTVLALNNTKKSPRSINRKIQKLVSEILSSPDFLKTLKENPGLKKINRQIINKFKLVQENIDGNSGFKRWFGKSKTEQALLKYEKALFANKGLSKYDYQVQLKMSDTASAQRLATKADSNLLPNVTVDIAKKGNLENNLKQAFGKLTHQSRLYITGHGSPDRDFLTYDADNENVKTRVEDIVEMLNKYAPHLKKRTMEEKLNFQRLKISLNVCYGACGRPDYKSSFAYRLSKALYEAGFEVEVIGRAGSVVVTYDPETDNFYKKVELINYPLAQHKAPNSKFSFITNKNIGTHTRIVY